MSHLRTAARPAALAVSLFAMMAVQGACGPSGYGSGGWSGDEEMNRAVASFISGDFHDAAARLEVLADEADSPEQLSDVYWYLGRCYFETGQYHRAIDAFTAGKAHGGGAAFDAYLARLDALVSGAPDSVERSDRVTRMQLAVLIDRMFFPRAPDPAASPPPAGPGGAASQLSSVARGVVGHLPDGKFHPGAVVTRGGFYAAVSRLIAETGIDAATADFFEGGFAWALEAGSVTFVTGKDVVATLRRVVAAQHTYGRPSP